MDVYTKTTVACSCKKNSLFFKIFSLLICVGNYAKTARSAAISRSRAKGQARCHANSPCCALLPQRQAK
jgi:hypothetical protein